MLLFSLLACFVVVNGNGIVLEQHQPQPYKFGYTIKAKDGVQHREEAGNGAGVVQGNYAIIDNKGLHRQVNYVADHAGFRAAIKTNEPGTAGQSPAATVMMSNDPYAQGAALPYNSRVNSPVVPALYNSDPVYGFPTIYGPRAYGNGHGLVGTLNHGGLVGPLNNGMVGHLNHGLVGHLNQGLVGSLNHGMVGPLNHQGLISPLNQGLVGNLNGYGGNYAGGLGYSNLLGAGYRNAHGIVNFGGNLIGGVITGYNSGFAPMNV